MHDTNKLTEDSTVYIDYTEKTSYRLELTGADLVEAGVDLGTVTTDEDLDTWLDANISKVVEQFGNNADGLDEELAFEEVEVTNEDDGE
jgi:hypothetical protein